ncbi:unnamed protein product [Trichobilharzia regenti]|nr:unnamed protein product [Trichobilharzia regenti]
MPRIHHCDDGEKSTESKIGEMKELIAIHNNSNNNDNADLHKNPNQNNKCVRDFTNFEELKKEYEKQELLISGYQRENEKLYAHIKNLKKVSSIARQNCIHLHLFLRGVGGGIVLSI